jgi:hypothetical protein
MSTSKEKYIEAAKEISSVYARNFATYNKLKTLSLTTDLPASEKKLLDELQKTLLEVSSKISPDASSSDSVKEIRLALPGNVLTQVQTVFADDNQDTISTLFNYSPSHPPLDLLVVSNGTINTRNQILGPNTKYANNFDDLFYYSNSPIFNILGIIKENIHNPAPIIQDDLLLVKDSKYIYDISFSFKLDRFPTFTYFDNKKKKYFTNSTRRTDIISFNYAPRKGNINSISVGALAPFIARSEGKTSPSGHFYKYTQRPYHNKHTPFSLAVNLPLTGGIQSTSYYTDYKFQLNTWYNVKIRLQVNSIEEDRPVNSTLQIYVNGDLQEIASHKGKVWSKRISNQRKKSQNLASGPRFTNANGTTHIENSLSYTHRNLDGIMLSQLKTITTPPYSINSQLHFNPKYFGEERYVKKYFNNVWSHHKQQMNTAINYGDILITKTLI